MPFLSELLVKSGKEKKGPRSMNPRCRCCMQVGGILRQEINVKEEGKSSGGVV